MTLANNWQTYLRRFITALLSWSFLSGLLFLNTTVAQATFIKVETSWNGANPNAFADTTAFIESTSFTGIGIETIAVTSFDIRLFDIRPNRRDLFFAAELDSINMAFINFDNGVVRDYLTTSPLRVPLDPGPNSFLLDATIDRMVIEFHLVGQRNYKLQPGSTITFPTTAIPLPGTWVLLLSGLVILVGRSIRRSMKKDKNINNPGLLPFLP